MSYNSEDGGIGQERLPRFLAFLVKVAEAVEARAEEEGVGTVTHEILKLREKTEVSNGLSCLQLTYANEEGEETHFRLFAAGSYRDKSLIKVEREEDEDYVLVSSNPTLILSYISF